MVGATGMIGGPLAQVLEERGHEVRRLARTSEWPVDVRTGEGLHAALDGMEAVVNATNGPSSGRAAPILVDGTRNLLEAGGAAHHVCISIVGIDRVPVSYYRVKLAQEAAVRTSGASFSIVRATQLHELVGPPLQSLGRWRIALRSNALLQPIDAHELAEALADVAEREPRGETFTVAGPEILTLTEMRTRPGVPVPLPLPPRLRRSLRRGALTIDDPDVRGTATYARWLTR